MITNYPALLFILVTMLALHQLASCDPLVSERDPMRERGTMKVDGNYWERP
jgi:hypothetical protein